MGGSPRRSGTIGLYRSHNHDLAYQTLAAAQARKPRAAYTGGAGNANISAGDTVVRSATIVADVAGTIVADATASVGSAAFFGARCSLGFGTTMDMDFAQEAENPNGIEVTVISVTRHFRVDPGTHTVNFVCAKAAGAGTITAQRGQLSLLFVAD